MAVGACAYRHEDCHPRIDANGIKNGDTALDDAIFFKFLDAAPAWRRGKANFLGNVCHRKCRVFLQ
ncbi:hypothetical protein D3C71_2218870 [compost metagenome]